MLDKLFGKKQPPQSQSIGNVTGQVQATQAGQDATATANQAIQTATQQQGLSGAEVVALLEQLKGAIVGADLDSELREELLDYLKPAVREAGKAEPDKQLIGDNLQRVGETMKHLKETTEAGKTLWQTGAEVFKSIAPWLGLAAGFFG